METLFQHLFEKDVNVWVTPARNKLLVRQSPSISWARSAQRSRRGRGAQRRGSPGPVPNAQSLSHVVGEITRITDAFLAEGFEKLWLSTMRLLLLDKCFVSKALYAFKGSLH